MPSRRWIVLLTCGALLLCGLSGWLIAGEREHDDDGDREEAAEMLTVFEVLVSGLITPSAALEAAAKSASGTPFEMELSAVQDAAGRRVAWEVEFVDGNKVIEVMVDAKSGKVIATETEEEDEEQAEERAERLAKKPLPLATVLGNLSKSLAGSLVTIELDDEDDGVFWEAVVLHGGRVAEVLVEGTTGKIVPGGDDDDDDDDDEDDEDEDD